MKRQPPTSSCASGKVAFRTQGDALRALDKIRKDNAQAVVPMPFEPRSAYHCDCGAWHLTKRESGVHIA